jgi:hypothetical protein
MFFKVLVYSLIGFAVLDLIVCHIQWFKIRKILKKEHASINVIDNFLPFRYMGKFRTFVGSCSDDNKRTKYFQVYNQTRTWQTITLLLIAVTVVAYLLVM